MEWIITDDNHESPSGEEPNNDGNLVGSGTLKKGPWTPAEDAILAEYVRKHGDGNWNAVQKFSGLSRCGKSCRLRWANHLRPDLKKGAFTPEEERTIIKLHAKLGNKWARMAAKLPGRTDNEIKNFWNTRIKRLQRAGLQIYPDDVLCLNKSSETQQSQDSGTYSIECPRSHDFMKAGNFEIPVFEMEPNFGSELYSHQSKLLGIPPSNMLQQGFLPSCGISYPSSIIHPRKRLRESDTSHGLNDTATSCFLSQKNSNFPGKPHQPYELPPYHSIGKPSLSFLSDSHVLINGNPSTSDPNFGPQKLELPSFQTSAYDFSSWDDPRPLLPGLQCTDTLDEPPQAEPNQVQYTPDTDGLLESLVWPKKRVKTSEYETVPKEKITSDLDDPLLDLSNPVWHLFTAPLPPMEPSAASIFSDFSPNDVMLGPQAKTCDADPQQHPIDPTSPDLNHITDYSNQLDLWRPDYTWWDANLLSLDKYNLALQEVVPGFKDDTNYLHQHPLPGQF